MADVMTIKIGADLSSLERAIQDFDRKVGSKTRTIKYRVDDSFSAPLGRLTSATKSFDAALDAATKRVVAFGVTAGILSRIKTGFDDLIKSTVQVDQALARIGANLKQNIGRDIFDAAKASGQSFEVAAKAAEELSKQGLTATETIKRLGDALSLSRRAQIDSGEAVRDITASMNSFSREALTSTQILDRFSAISTKFPASVRDLSDAIERSGETAQKAGVSYNQLLGYITAIQSQTQRGGQAIGSGLNNLFEKIQNPDTLNKLNSFGINTKDGKGNVLGANDILGNVAQKYFAGSTQYQALLSSELVGQRQDNSFIALLKGINGGPNSIVNQAIGAANNSTGAAAAGDARYNRTIGARLNNLGVNGEQFFSSLGKNVFNSGPVQAGFGAAEGATSFFGNKNKDSLGRYFGDGILQGITNVLTGPGLATIGILLAKTVGKVISAGLDQTKSVLGLVTLKEQQAALQTKINELLEQANQSERKGYLAAENSVAQAKVLLSIKERIAEVDAQDASDSANLYRALTTEGPGGVLGARRVPTLAGGYLGGAIAAEQQAISSGVGGASSGASPVIIPDFNFGGGKIGPVVANSDEHIVRNYAGGDAIFNQEMSRSYGLPDGAQHLAGGRIPNFVQGFRGTQGSNEIREYINRGFARPMHRDGGYFTPEKSLAESYANQGYSEYTNKYKKLGYLMYIDDPRHEDIKVYNHEHSLMGNNKVYVDKNGFKSSDIVKIQRTYQKNGQTFRGKHLDFNRFSQLYNGIYGGTNAANGYIPNYASVTLDDLTPAQAQEIVKKYKINQGKRTARQAVSTAIRFGNEDVSRAVSRARSNTLAQQEQEYIAANPGTFLNSSFLYHSKNQEGKNVSTNERNDLQKALLDYIKSIKDGKDGQEELNKAIDTGREVLSNKSYEEYRHKLRSSTGSFPSQAAVSFASQFEQRRADESNTFGESETATEAFERADRARAKRIAKNFSGISASTRRSNIENEFKKRSSGLRGFFNEPLNLVNDIISKHQGSGDDKEYLEGAAEIKSQKRFQTRQTLGLGAAFLAPFLAGFIPQNQGGSLSGVAGGAASGAVQGASTLGLFGPIGILVGGLGGALAGAVTKATKSMEEFQEQLDQSEKILKDNSDAAENYLKIQEKLSNTSDPKEISQLSSQLTGYIGQISDPQLKKSLVSGTRDDQEKAVKDFNDRSTEIVKGNTAAADIFNITQTKFGAAIDYLGDFYHGSPRSTFANTNSPEQLSKLAKDFSSVENEDIFKNTDRTSLRAIADGNNGQESRTIVRDFLDKLGGSNGTFKDLQVSSQNVSQLAEGILASFNVFQHNLKDTKEAIDNVTKNAGKAGLNAGAFLSPSASSLQAIAKVGQLTATGQFGSTLTPIQKDLTAYQGLKSLYQESSTDINTLPDDQKKQFLRLQGINQQQNILAGAEQFLRSNGSTSTFRNRNGDFIPGAVTNALQYRVNSGNPVVARVASTYLDQFGKAQNDIDANGGAGIYGAGSTSSDDYVIGTKYSTYAGSRFNKSPNNPLVKGAINDSIKNSREADGANIVAPLTKSVDQLNDNFNALIKILTEEKGGSENFNKLVSILTGTQGKDVNITINNPTKEDLDYVMSQIKDIKSGRPSPPVGKTAQRTY